MKPGRVSSSVPNMLARWFNVGLCGAAGLAGGVTIFGTEGAGLPAGLAIMSVGCSGLTAIALESNVEEDDSSVQHTANTLQGVSTISSSFSCVGKSIAACIDVLTTFVSTLMSDSKANAISDTVADALASFDGNEGPGVPPTEELCPSQFGSRNSSEGFKIAIFDRFVPSTRRKFLVHLPTRRYTAL